MDRSTSAQWIWCQLITSVNLLTVTFFLCRQDASLWVAVWQWASSGGSALDVAASTSLGPWVSHPPADRNLPPDPRRQGRCRPWGGTSTSWTPCQGCPSWSQTHAPRGENCLVGAQEHWDEPLQSVHTSQQRGQAVDAAHPAAGQCVLSTS